MCFNTESVQVESKGDARLLAVRRVVFKGDFIHEIPKI